jgi:hypothetical protein
MDDEREKRGRGVWIVVLLFAPILYVLSTGPLRTIRRHGYLTGPAGQAFVDIAYGPEMWLYDNSAWYAQISNKYLSLF